MGEIIRLPVAENNSAVGEFGELSDPDNSFRNSPNMKKVSEIIEFKKGILRILHAMGADEWFDIRPR